jgi:hypothetical protein
MRVSVDLCMYFQIFHDGLPQLSGGTADHSKSFGPRAANDGSHMIAPWADFKPTTFTTYCTPMDIGTYWNLLRVFYKFPATWIAHRRKNGTLPAWMCTKCEACFMREIRSFLIFLVFTLGLECGIIGF